MKRRHFLKAGSMAGLLAMVVPQNLWAYQTFTTDDLLGKGTPELFGEGKLRKQAHEAFLNMKEAAAKEGFTIKIVSGYRNFDRQKLIFERKYKKFTQAGLSSIEAINKIIEYSTIPGTSRHHWGTDIDIIDDHGNYEGDVLVADKFHGEGPFCKFREWLEQHANTFGFYIVYTNDPDRKGFKYEPWHYSYAPISKPMLQAYKKLDIRKILQEQNLAGSDYFTESFMDAYIKNHILDINPQLKP
ncbi:M15 family metallopeptidase [Ascidiimonas aurantiaca]|uniref:M15 family metallopeptidase n=1 Tax=Ascidiimonas aurantiaca TaxID=1685432 RepID=UPI0030EB5671